MSGRFVGAAQCLVLVVATALAVGVSAPAAGARASAPAADRSRSAPDPVALLANAAPGARAKPDQFVVTVTEGTDVEDVLADAPGAVKVMRRFAAAADGFTARMRPSVARALARDSRIQLVEPNWIFTTSATQEDPTWGLDRIDQRRRPLTATYTYASKGRGVRVYVIDTGVYGRHREFGDRVIRGYDVFGRGSTRDCHGHGTHVAATIAGRRFGVAKAATIVPVRAGCGQFTVGALVASLDFVARHHRAGRPAVVNMSLGGPYSRSVNAAVRRVIDDGVTVVTAAGNTADDACYTSPGSVGAALTVGATNRYDRVADFSNHGSCVDVFAPGVKVRSAGLRSRRDSRLMSGTSMAAPHVAGVAARLLGGNPASPATIGRRIRSSAVSGRISGMWYSDADRLLQLPGRSRARLTQNVPAKVTAFERVRVAGRLRDAVSGRAMAGRVVNVYHRPLGGAWSRLATATTNADGVAARLVRIPRSGYVQLRHPGAPDSAPATAAATSVSVVKAATTLFMGYLDPHAYAGDTVPIDGSLYRSSSFTAVSSATVLAETRDPLTDTWATVGSGRTNAYGEVSIEFTATVTSLVRLRFAGNDNLLPSTSGAPQTITVEDPPAG